MQRENFTDLLVAALLAAVIALLVRPGGHPGLGSAPEPEVAEAPGRVSAMAPRGPMSLLHPGGQAW